MVMPSAESVRPAPGPLVIIRGGFVEIKRPKNRARSMTIFPSYIPPARKILSPLLEFSIRVWIVPAVPFPL